MDCASCVSHVSKAAASLAGVRRADVHLARGRAVVEFDPAQVQPEQIAQAISQAGYPSKPQGAHHDSAGAEAARIQHQREHARQWMQRAVLGIVLWLPVELMHWFLPLLGVHGVVIGSPGSGKSTTLLALGEAVSACADAVL